MDPLVGAAHCTHWMSILFSKPVTTKREPFQRHPTWVSGFIFCNRTNLATFGWRKITTSLVLKVREFKKKKKDREENVDIKNGPT